MCVYIYKYIYIYIQTVAAICHCATICAREQLYPSGRENRRQSACHTTVGRGRRAQTVCPLPILHLAQDASLAARIPVVVWR